MAAAGYPVQEETKRENAAIIIQRCWRKRSGSLYSTLLERLTDCSKPNPVISEESGGMITGRSLRGYCLPEGLLAGISDGGVVVDVGCGTGRAVREIAATYSGCTVIAIDCNKGLIKIVLMNPCPSNLSFCDAIDALPGKVDLFIDVFGAVTYSEDPFDTINMLLRKLKVGGKLFIQTASPNMQNWLAFALTSKVEHIGQHVATGRVFLSEEGPKNLADIVIRYGNGINVEQKMYADDGPLLITIEKKEVAAVIIPLCDEYLGKQIFRRDLPDLVVYFPREPKKKERVIISDDDCHGENKPGLKKKLNIGAVRITNNHDPIKKGPVVSNRTLKFWRKEIKVDPVATGPITLRDSLVP